MSIRAILLPIALVSTISVAQQPGEAVPVEVALEAIAAAYENHPTADEVTVRFKTRVGGAGGGGERQDTLVIRLQPGPTPRSGPARMFLDLGQLKVLAADGQLTAISTAAPDKFAQRTFEPPLTPTVLGRFLPPVPLPQLAFSCGIRDEFRNPTPYTARVDWTSAIADTASHPQTVTITGMCPTGPVTLVSDAKTGRLLRLSATIQERQGPSTLELTCRAVEPGDPAQWTVKTEGRERVAGVADLKPAPAKRQGLIEPPQPAPDLACSKPDLTPWTLHGSMAGASQPLALLVFRRPGVSARDDAFLGDAKAGLALLRNLHRGTALTGETPGRREPLAFRTAAAVAIELSSYSRDRWDEARRGWSIPVSRGRSPTAPLDLEADELMWTGAGGAFIDRFHPGAGAIVLVVGPDAAVRAAIKLDGRDPAVVGPEIRAAIQGSPVSQRP